MKEIDVEDTVTSICNSAVRKCRRVSQSTPPQWKYQILTMKMPVSSHFSLFPSSDRYPFGTVTTTYDWLGECESYKQIKQLRQVSKHNEVKRSQGPGDGARGLRQLRPPRIRAMDRRFQVSMGIGNQECFKKELGTRPPWSKESDQKRLSLSQTINISEKRGTENRHTPRQTTDNRQRFDIRFDHGSVTCSTSPSTAPGSSASRLVASTNRHANASTIATSTSSAERIAAFQRSLTHWHSKTVAPGPFLLDLTLRSRSYDSMVSQAIRER